eukprot:1143713-Pelagomonas_calceolata.AAC.4
MIPETRALQQRTGLVNRKGTEWAYTCLWKIVTGVTSNRHNEKTAVPAPGTVSQPRAWLGSKYVLNKPHMPPTFCVQHTILSSAGSVNLLGEALASLLVRGPFLNARSWTWLA